ncbi:MAG: DNA topoisomerase (ATP-hydrolyzing) subunit A [Mycoplasmatales bacterium]
MSQKNVNMTIEDIFAKRFGRYSKYIIQERALPDVRDGLKPVQRRILYAMNQDNNTFDKQFRKSAKTVGNVIGNYHPHGDTSVYEAMVRMSQTWKINEQLVIMHGNNGSIDGDNPAAMRYTEAKLSEYSNFMLQDIYKQTVKMVPNFDDTELEPSVLPSRIPNLLINGTSGIASGYATEIPPHNMQEVLQAAIFLNQNEEATLTQLMKYIKAPDFPTGGTIQGIEEVKKAYETGRGKIAIVAKYEIIKNEILISEIPYEVNKATLLQKIELLKIEKKVQGIEEIVDQSDQSGLEIKIVCSKNVSAQMVMNFLLKQTDLKKNYNFNMIAIANKKPQLMGLKQILSSFLKHREDVVIKRSNYELNKCKTRLEIVSGLMIAVDNLDLVVKIIRASKDKSDAKENLIKQFNLTENQAEAIVMMQLYRLTNTDITKLEQEYQELEAKIKELKNILNDRLVLKDIINQELEAILKELKTKRKSAIQNEVEDIVVHKADLIKEEKNILVLTQNKYIKRTNLRSYLTAKSSPQLIQGDKIDKIISIKNKDNLLVFFDDGTYALLPAYEIEENKWKDVGKNLSLLIKDIDQTKVVNIIPYQKETEIISITQQGYMLKVKIEDFEVKKLNKKIKYQKIKEKDQVASVTITQAKEDLIIITDNDNYQVLNNELLEHNTIKRVGTKIKALNKKEKIKYINIIKDNILLFSNQGYYVLVKKENLNLANFRFELLFTNLKSNQQNMEYILTDVTNLVSIKENEYLKIAKTELTKSQVGDKIRNLMKVTMLEKVIKEIEL